MNHPQPFFALYCAALKSNLDLTNSYLKGVRRIHECQIDQIDASSSEQKAYLQQLDGAGDMGALTAMCSDMVSGFASRVSTYWRELARECAAIQSELAHAMQAYEVQVVQDLRQQAEHMKSSMSQGNTLLKPVLDPVSIFAFATGTQADGGAGMGQQDHGPSGYARATDVKSRSRSRPAA